MVGRSSIERDNRTGRGASTEKLSGLLGSLSPTPLKTYDPAVNLTELQLGERLFAKAGSIFVERKSLADLKHIHTEALRILTLAGDTVATEQNERIVIHFERFPLYTAIYLRLKDRPFIVNTIRAALEQAEIDILSFLHPIFGDTSSACSLCYLEVAPLDDSKTAIVHGLLHDVLAELVVATNDYQPMRSALSSISTVDLIPANGAENVSPKEIAAFIEWLSEGGFLFLGLANWQITKRESHQIGQPLGILRPQAKRSAELFPDLGADIAEMRSLPRPINLSRLRSGSLIQRQRQLAHLMIATNNKNQGDLRIVSVVGLFTSKAITQEPASIPIVRAKFQTLVTRDHAVQNTYAYKNLEKLIGNMPIDELLPLTDQGLLDLVHTLGEGRDQDRVSLVLRRHNDHRGVSIIVALPREQFNRQTRERFQRFLEQEFDAADGSCELSIDLSHQYDARLYFYLPLTGDVTGLPSVQELESGLSLIAKSWSDCLQSLIVESGNHFSAPEEIVLKYRNSFPEDYQARHSGEEALFDIASIERLLASQDPILSEISTLERVTPESFWLILYRRDSQITVSQALPILECVGLDVIEEESNEINLATEQSVFIHRFLVRMRDGSALDLDNFNSFLAPAMPSILLGERTTDALNSLMLSAGLDLRAVRLLRAYCHFLWQVSDFATRETMIDTIANNPAFGRRLWEFFQTRFDPQSFESPESRSQRSEELLADYLLELRSVSDLTQDRVLRYLVQLINHTVRTSYYQAGDTIALKFHSEAIDWLPSPRPLYEIFVYAPQCRGVHLRFGKVSRGGLRWSERPDDYRTEVLGLVKTQKIKNAIIIPDGAKGGFVLPKPPQKSADLPAAVELAYRTFIRGLLSITDNRHGAEILRPPNVTAHDGDDPYLVVAADKGTAKFSDIANGIAVEEFQFWLGDAFASGGSQGYDHKSYGITARGAWESVKRHFKALAIDESKPFTVIGIGDMSGDVFGNGMLLSDKICLIAAFDHRHIFIDPAPDPLRSFAERQRLFLLPRSAWTDYRSELISEGGGIFGRYEKEIRLNSRIRAALDVPAEVPDLVNSEALVRLILKAPAHLLWNGGIGTYVKGRDQSNGDIGDTANDNVRVSANELRVRVVSEGGNLGVSQRGRVEFALAGGKINTDAIDNSGGVDLSDHEVNLKILFSDLESRGEVPRAERDRLLKEVAEDVVDSVLSHNRNHALILAAGVERSKRNIQYFRSLIQDLSRRGFINRALEALPDDEELLARSKRGDGLVPPEIAVCLSGMKLWLKGELLASKLVSDPLLERFLLGYFPKLLRERFKSEILKHPLAREIVASEVTNFMIDTVGVSFVHRMCRHGSIPATTVLTAALAAELVVETDAVRIASFNFDSLDQQPLFMKIRRDLNRTLRQATSWIINNFGHSVTLAEVVKSYQAPYKAFTATISESSLSGSFLPARERFQSYRADALPEQIRRSLYLYASVQSILEIIRTAQEFNVSVAEVASIYNTLVDSLHLNPILTIEERVLISDKWERELLSQALHQIRRGVSDLTINYLRQGISGDAAIAELISANEQALRLRSLVLELNRDQIPVAAISVVAKQLGTIVTPPAE